MQLSQGSARQLRHGSAFPTCLRHLHESDVLWRQRRPLRLVRQVDVRHDVRHPPRSEVFLEVNLQAPSCSHGRVRVRAHASMLYVGADMPCSSGLPGWSAAAQSPGSQAGDSEQSNDCVRTVETRGAVLRPATGRPLCAADSVANSQIRYPRLTGSGELGRPAVWAGGLTCERGCPRFAVRPMREAFGDSDGATTRRAPYRPTADSVRPVSASKRWARSRSTVTDMRWPGVPVTVGRALTLSISLPTLTSTTVRSPSGSSP